MINRPMINNVDKIPACCILLNNVTIKTGRLVTCSAGVFTPNKSQVLLYKQQTERVWFNYHQNHTLVLRIFFFFFEVQLN